MFYSKTTGGFYSETIHAGSIPADAVEVDDSKYQQLMLAQSSGKIIASDETGNPVAVDLAQKSVPEMLDAVKDEVRKPRAEMLDALNGIASRAQRAGNAELATEADAIALQLLDITDDPALNAATTLEDMRAAAMSVYRRIAVGASDELASVFKEITGA